MKTRPEPAPADDLNRKRTREIRLDNLNNLILKFEQEEGGQALLRRFAKHAGLSENHLSQIRNGDKGIGDVLAQKIEVNLHLGRGWMDAEHTDWTAETPEERAHLAQLRASMRSLSPADQRKAIRLLQRFVSTVTKPQRPRKKLTRT